MARVIHFEIQASQPQALASWNPTRRRRRPTGRKPERDNRPQPWT
jgi:hypothetical protein